MVKKKEKTPHPPQVVPLPLEGKAYEKMRIAITASPQGEAVSCYKKR